MLHCSFFPLLLFLIIFFVPFFHFPPSRRLFISVFLFNVAVFIIPSLICLILVFLRFPFIFSPCRDKTFNLTLYFLLSYNSFVFFPPRHHSCNSFSFFLAEANTFSSLIYFHRELRLSVATLACRLPYFPPTRDPRNSSTGSPRKQLHARTAFYFKSKKQQNTSGLLYSTKNSRISI